MQGGAGRPAESQRRAIGERSTSEIRTVTAPSTKPAVLGGGIDARGRPDASGADATVMGPVLGVAWEAVASGLRGVSI